jgi:hypothetical protein
LGTNKCTLLDQGKGIEVARILVIQVCGMGKLLVVCVQIQSRAMEMAVGVKLITVRGYVNVQVKPD